MKKKMAVLQKYLCNVIFPSEKMFNFTFLLQIVDFSLENARQFLYILIQQQQLNEMNALALQNIVLYAHSKIKAEEK